MENHNFSTSNILLKTLDDDILITVTLTISNKDGRIENKNSTTPSDHQFSLETEMTALKSFVLEQLFLIKKSIQEVKDPNHETANSTCVTMLMEQIEYLKAKMK